MIVKTKVSSSAAVRFLSNSHFCKVDLVYWKPPKSRYEQIIEPKSCHCIDRISWKWLEYFNGFFFVVAFPWHKNCFRIKEILICPTGDRRNPVLRVLVRLLYEIVCDNILWHFLHFGYEELIFDIKYHFDLNVRKCNYIIIQYL